MGFIGDNPGDRRQGLLVAATTLNFELVAAFPQ
jgi:hypothetical protein